MTPAICSARARSFDHARTLGLAPSGRHAFSQDYRGWRDHLTATVSRTGGGL